MSLSRAGSFSVRIRTPVAWGANTWTTPFLMPEAVTAFWVFSVRSIKSISPWVLKWMVC